MDVILASTEAGSQANVGARLTITLACGPWRCCLQALTSHRTGSGEPGCRPAGILFLQFSTEIIVKKNKPWCRCLLEIQKHLRYFTWRHGHWHSAQDVLTDKSSESLKNSVAGSLKRSSSSSFCRLLYLLFLFSWSFSLIHVRPHSRSVGLMECDGQSSERSCQVNLWKRPHLTPAGWLWHQQQTSAETGG